MIHVAGLIFGDVGRDRLIFVRNGRFWVLPGGMVESEAEAYELLPRLAYGQIGAKVRLQGRREEPVMRQGDTLYFDGLLVGDPRRMDGTIASFDSHSVENGMLDPVQIYETDRLALKELYGWNF